MAEYPIFVLGDEDIDQAARELGITLTEAERAAVVRGFKRAADALLE